MTTSAYSLSRKVDQLEQEKSRLAEELSSVTNELRGQTSACQLAGHQINRLEVELSVVQTKDNTLKSENDRLLSNLRLFRRKIMRVEKEVKRIMGNEHLRSL